MKRLLLRLHASGVNVALIVFSGLLLPLAGVLVSRSGLFPRFLGWLLILAGPCHLLQSFSFFLAPPLARQLFPWVLIPCFLAEAAMTLWLLVVGLDLRRWEQAHAAEKNRVS
ncbi:MAG: DUF4386 domain-containing protein [Caulobacteraceae bacterium]|nr:DUF4386 domain-containing protein [Caulobacteraceae bacterium]